MGTGASVTGSSVVASREGASVVPELSSESLASIITSSVSSLTRGKVAKGAMVGEGSAPAKAAGDTAV